MNSMKIITFIILLLRGTWSFSLVSFTTDKNISNVATALVEIINGLKPSQLTILAPRLQEQDIQNAAIQYQHGDNLQKDVDDFIYQLHKLHFKTIIYYDVELFFQFIEFSLQGSIENVNLIFAQPYELSVNIQERKLSHRLSLFIFYWGAKHPPKAHDVRFEEPMRAVVITRPRQKAFRIYYNQAVPYGFSNLYLVNWYDGDNLGLNRIPVLPSSASVYSNFRGRIFRVPVFHSPPWFWVNYNNDSIETNITLNEEDDNDDYSASDDLVSEELEISEVNVTGGRDHCLLKLLADRMNFQFIYIDAPGRTQGSLRSDGENNETFTGAIGLLQNRQADLLLGDVGLSWERRKVVEFSFFTLADSGAFATHAPRRLNEALAILRPFKIDVWPYLIVTVLFTGPIFYAIIAIPYKWHMHNKNHDIDIEYVGDTKYYMVYIKEINFHTNRLLPTNTICKRQNAVNEMPKDLFVRCIWFTVQLFLKQSCKEVYHGYRAKFLMIVYWIAATYVLSDVYSAQLTSQFARPPHEPSINTLYRLQYVMLNDGYQLFVEKESSSLEMLENGTEIFRQLYALMKQQQQLDMNQQGFLIDSVEAGIKLIADGLENKVVLAGRETLFFNIQQFGSKTFQLSQKLYTRYSAVAVQIGCPFLDSLNSILIRLFEGGILEKMTSAEYATQSRLIGKQLKAQNNKGKDKVLVSTNYENNANGENTHINANENEATNGHGKNSINDGTQTQKQHDNARQIIKPLNLRMLQGAFFILLFGYVTAGLILYLELGSVRWQWKIQMNNFHLMLSIKRIYQQFYKCIAQFIRYVLIHYIR